MPVSKKPNDDRAQVTMKNGDAYELTEPTAKQLLLFQGALESLPEMYRNDACSTMYAFYHFAAPKRYDTFDAFLDSLTIPDIKKVAEALEFFRDRIS